MNAVVNLSGVGVGVGAGQINPNKAMVTTTLGELPESDLEIKMIPQPSNADTWIMARECRYKGEIVRRDVWVTIKSGQSAKAEGKL